MSNQEPTKYTAKKDSYSRSRGASQFYDLFCVSCQAHLLLYQKDGPGALRRLYLDRITAPADLPVRQPADQISDVPNLECRECGALIGVPMIYRPEKRFAIRLIQGAFSKVRSDGTYPPEALPTTKA